MTTSSSIMALHKLLERTGQCYPCVPTAYLASRHMPVFFILDTVLFAMPCLYEQFAIACTLRRSVCCLSL